MSGPMLVRSREEVCRDRASLAADEKFDEIIKEKRNQYNKVRDIKLMQEIIKLSRAKKSFFNKAYKHYLDNYILASDSVSSKVPDKIRSSYKLRDISNYITEELSKI